MNLKQVVEKLNQFAPLKLGESWDNIGLLVEPPCLTQVSLILLTNDLTLDVMAEAEERKVDMILSYHPPIFQPLKRITMDDWKQEIVGRCLSKNIAIYSPHTAYDALQGGVNDWLISAFGGTCRPIQQMFLDSESFSHIVSLHLHEESDAIDQIKRVLSDDSDVRFHQDGHNFKIFTNLSKLADIIKKCKQSVKEFNQHVDISITKPEKVPLSDHGVGRISNLDVPITLKNALKKIKRHTGLTHVRVAVKHGGSMESQIKTVSVCAGSGGSILSGVKSDLLFTGEMNHHQVLDFTQRGHNVVLVEHSNSERGFLKLLRTKLLPLLENVEIIVSETDKDPLVIV